MRPFLLRIGLFPSLVERRSGPPCAKSACNRQGGVVAPEVTVSLGTQILGAGKQRPLTSLAACQCKTGNHKLRHKNNHG
jgi:hypothetical protein